MQIGQSQPVQLIVSTGFRDPVSKDKVKSSHTILQPPDTQAHVSTNYSMLLAENHTYITGHRKIIDGKLKICILAFTENVVSKRK